MPEDKKGAEVILTKEKLVIATMVLGLITIFWQVSNHFQKQSYRIETLEREAAEQETTNSQILVQLKEITQSINHQTRATDRLTFEIDKLKEK